MITSNNSVGRDGRMISGRIICQPGSDFGGRGGQRPRYTVCASVLFYWGHVSLAWVLAS